MDTSVILDSGHTAWMIVATLLVFMMTIPGIALFYGGLVRQKNMLSLVMQSLAIAGVVSILWVVFGYSLAFGTGYEGSGFFKYGIGGFDKVMLNGIGLDTLTATGIPEMLFVMFQCMFALITPALILGAFAERVRFAGFLCFTVLWSILVYMPMAHWVWGGGFLMEMGAVDFAGGTVVHVNAGVAALVMALMVGRRKDYRAGRPITPHNIPFVFLGTALLWLGWFGFNAGSSLAANSIAVKAFLNTNTASATAMMTWVVFDCLRGRKPSAMGAAIGAVVGLVAITPSAGYVTVGGRIFIALVVTVICNMAVSWKNKKNSFDDALDVFPTHGVGGIVGTIMTGIFVYNATENITYWQNLLNHIIAVVIVCGYTFIVTYALYWITDKMIPMRVSEKSEKIGLDMSQHDERYGIETNRELAEYFDHGVDTKS